MTSSLKPTSKCRLHSSSRNLLFTIGRHNTENHNPSKCRVVKQSLRGHIYKTLTPLRLKEEKEVERLTEPEISESTDLVSLCLGGMSETILKGSPA